MHSGKSGNASPTKVPTTVFYPADGTGRDSYVANDSGGMIGSYNTKGNQKLFLNSLRNYKEQQYANRPSELT